VNLLLSVCLSRFLTFPRGYRVTVMKIREDSTKGETMDKQEIREEAWQEGAEAAWEWSVSREEGFPDNPYTPEVECTPSHQEITDTLLGTFTWDEIGRYLHQRELNIAALERLRVAGELERLKETLDLGASGMDWYKLSAINDCVDAIKRLTG
jgi:hypothetical protein